ncbi:hypothetical protein BDZ45DRAFT_753263 [Acephala macrosclerotiorum]|nr:hypothetical protein BDZ45DRAFT_753263 [Acephala macrosclerotiorum]
MNFHASEYAKELGMNLCIYMAPSKDKKNVFVSATPPRIPALRLVPHPSEDIVARTRDKTLLQVVISASQSKGHLTLIAKYTITLELEEAIALARRVLVAFALISDEYDCGRFPVLIDSNYSAYGFGTLFIKSLVSEKSISPPGVQSQKALVQCVLHWKTLFRISMHVLNSPEMKLFVLAGKRERQAVLDCVIIAQCLRYGRENGATFLNT